MLKAHLKGFAQREIFRLKGRSQLERAKVLQKQIYNKVLAGRPSQLFLFNEVLNSKQDKEEQKNYSTSQMTNHEKETRRASTFRIPTTNNDQSEPSILFENAKSSRKQNKSPVEIATTSVHLELPSRQTQQMNSILQGFKPIAKRIIELPNRPEVFAPITQTEPDERIKGTMSNRASTNRKENRRISTVSSGKDDQ